MHVSQTHIALATDDVKAALQANPMSLAQDESVEADLYWKLVRLVATETDVQAVTEAVMFTLREKVEMLITERAIQIAMDIEEGEARERFDRHYAETFFGSVQ